MSLSTNATAIGPAFPLAPILQPFKYGAGAVVDRLCSGFDEAVFSGVTRLAPLANPILKRLRYPFAGWSHSLANMKPRVASPSRALVSATLFAAPRIAWTQDGVSFLSRVTLTEGVVAVAGASALAIGVKKLYEVGSAALSRNRQIATLRQQLQEVQQQLNTFAEWRKTMTPPPGTFTGRTLEEINNLQKILQEGDELHAAVQEAAHRIETRLQELSKQALDQDALAQIAKEVAVLPPGRLTEIQTSANAKLTRLQNAVAFAQTPASLPEMEASYQLCATDLRDKNLPLGLLRYHRFAAYQNDIAGLEASRMTDPAYYRDLADLAAGIAQQPDYFRTNVSRYVEVLNRIMIYRNQADQIILPEGRTDQRNASLLAQEQQIVRFEAQLASSPAPLDLANVIRDMWQKMLGFKQTLHHDLTTPERFAQVEKDWITLNGRLPGLQGSLNNAAKIHAEAVLAPARQHLREMTANQEQANVLSKAVLATLQDNNYVQASAYCDEMRRLLSVSQQVVAEAEAVITAADRDFEDYLALHESFETKYQVVRALLRDAAAPGEDWQDQLKPGETLWRSQPIPAGESKAKGPQNWGAAKRVLERIAEQWDEFVVAAQSCQTEREDEVLIQRVLGDRAWILDKIMGAGFASHLARQLDSMNGRTVRVKWRTRFPVYFNTGSLRHNSPDASAALESVSNFLQERGFRFECSYSGDTSGIDFTLTISL